MWNNAEHLEAYLAIPSMGAVLHTLNLRLPAEQLVWIINHAEDRVVLVNGTLLPLLAPLLPQLPNARTRRRRRPRRPLPAGGRAGRGCTTTKS